MGECNSTPWRSRRRELVKKKTYIKPLLASRAVKLGVYGNYNDSGPNGKDGTGDGLPHPLKPLTDSDIHMD